jgi:hypothetical protein
MEGLGAALAFIAIGGILLLILAAIELIVFVANLREPVMRPDRRGWAILAGSLLLATVLGAGAYIGPLGGSLFIGLAVLVGLVTAVLLVPLLIGTPDRAVFLAFSVGVALEAGMFLGFFALPKLPLTGDVLNGSRCDADPYCADASAVVNASAAVTIHLAGNDGWSLDAAGDAECQLDPRSVALVKLRLSGTISATDGGAVRFDLLVGRFDETGDDKHVSLEMDRLSSYSGIYPRPPTLVAGGQGELALSQGELAISGVTLQHSDVPNEERADITGALQWGCAVAL